MKTKTLPKRLEAVEAFLSRLEKAKALHREGRVEPLGGSLYLVQGSRPYLVDLEEASCTCPDWGRGHACKHLVAAYLHEKEKKPKEKRVEVRI